MPRIKAHERTSACAIIIATVCATTGSALAADETPPPEPAGPDDRWTSYVGLGAQFLPDYDENGRGSGLNKQELFALVTADGRFGNDCGDRDEKGKLKETDKGNFQVCLNPLMGPWHTGATLTLLGTPVKREDKPSISPNEFNDVARTAVIAGYLSMPMIQSNDMVDNLGPIVRASAISRENLDTNMDSVTWTYGVGLQYTRERFRRTDIKAPNHLNAAPGGFVRLYAVRYEDYAGFGKTTRFVTDAAFQITKNGLYFGFQGNFGTGPDEMAVVLSFVRTPDEIAKLFNLGRE